MTDRKVINRRAKRLVTGPDEHGSTYVYFAPKGTKSATMHRHLGMVNIDYDNRGRIIGIEILDVKWRIA